MNPLSKSELGVLLSAVDSYRTASIQLKAFENALQLMIEAEIKKQIEWQFYDDEFEAIWINEGEFIDSKRVLFSREFAAYGVGIGDIEYHSAKVLDDGEVRID